MPSRRRCITAGVLALAVMLAGCGFHLQGRTPLPQVFKTACIESPDAQSDFVQQLRRALFASGAHVSDDSDKASAVIHILKDGVTRRVLSVSARNLPREYELTYTVQFAVSAQGRQLLPMQEVSAVRDFSFDESALLAKDNEEAILREALAHDLADMVMRRLRRL